MSFSADREEVSRGARAALLIPELQTADARASRRSRDGRVEEARGLALAIGLDVVADHVVRVRKAHPATLIGSGQVATLADIVADEEVALVVVDAALSPIQQRNLESRLGCKVIDRTALILEIFGERAVTAEGRLQVELAHLDYQQGRLVRSWTHLERQRGGFGFLGGPGETQIEADRRLIRDRMARIRRQLEDVKRTRTLHRQRRRRAPWPVVALVGYTNAGKSTLFNQLTHGDVLAEDMLFATLDPTMRAIRLAGLEKVIMSDTVGFVSDLPTQLVAAFRATLEEVTAADLLLHVRDISHPDSEAQRDDVLSILRDLGVLEGDAPADSGQEEGSTPRPRIVEIYNKIDQLDVESQNDVRANAARQGAIVISALTGEGVPELREEMAQMLGGAAITRDVNIADADGRMHAWLAAHSDIIASSLGADATTAYRVRISAINNARLDQLLHDGEAQGVA